MDHTVTTITDLMELLLFILSSCGEAKHWRV